MSEDPANPVTLEEDLLRLVPGRMGARIIQIFRFKDVASRDLVLGIARGIAGVGVEPAAIDDGRILIVESAGQFRANAIARLVRDLDDDAQVLDISNSTEE